MLLYVGSSSTLVGEVIGNEDLMSVAFDIVMVLDNHLLWGSLLVYIDTIWKFR